MTLDSSAKGIHFYSPELRPLLREPLGEVLINLIRSHELSPETNRTSPGLSYSSGSIFGYATSFRLSGAAMTVPMENQGTSEWFVPNVGDICAAGARQNFP
jgi:hypothetical protein